MSINENSDIPKVTVCVVTYNQEKYIAQCLQSIVDQKTNFNFDVIVSDDYSTDKTREIIQEFASKYSNLKPLLRAKNIGALKNFVKTHSLASGQYICHCDGDDYWLPEKLQEQTSYLDNNPICNVVFTRVYVENTLGELLPDLMDIRKIPLRGFYRSDVFRFVTLGTNSSKMYRRIDRHNYPDLPILDYFETVEQVGEGIVNYVNSNIYTVYRTGIGISSQGLSTRKALLDTFVYFSNEYPNEKVNINMATFILFISDFKNKRKTWKTGIKVFLQTFNIGVFYLIIKSLPVIKMLRSPH